METKATNAEPVSTVFVELSNGNLNNVIIEKAKVADATLTIAKSDVIDILLGQTTLKQLLEQGNATMTGDQQAFRKVASTLVQFDESFEIVPLR